MILINFLIHLSIKQNKTIINNNVFIVYRKKIE